LQNKKDCKTKHQQHQQATTIILTTQQHTQQTIINLQQSLVMSETDSTRGCGRGQEEYLKKSNAETSPLLGNKTASAESGREVYEESLFCFGFFSKRMFIGFMFFIALVLVKVCVSGRADEPPAPVVPVIPVRVVEDVVLPDR
jgi:hypothetical protein